ncbi:MAG: LytTR family DNA-binding domain-containing protein [Gemmatimonadales bacterium]
MTNTRKIRVCVVDDEPPARTGLTALLRADAELEVVGVCDSGGAAVESIERDRPDIVFLDVQMPEMNGFDVIRTVGASRMPLVVFTTAFDKYALDAFQAHAVDYLLKPFTDERFGAALMRAKTAVSERRLVRIGENIAALLEDIDRTPGTGINHRNAAGRITVRSNGASIFIPVPDIDWVEGADYYSRIHVGTRNYLLRETLSSLEGRLDSRQFCRAHRSAIVNVDRVREIQPSFGREPIAVMRDGAKVKLSRGKRALLESLIDARR